MTSLLRKFVAVRQRSKSPTKPHFNASPVLNHADHEFEHWSRDYGTLSPRPPPPPQRMPPQIRTQYVDDELELQALTYVNMNNNVAGNPATVPSTPNMNTIQSHASRSSVHDFGRSNSRLHLAENDLFPNDVTAPTRLRSESPQKIVQEVIGQRSRSKSPKKKSSTPGRMAIVKQTFDYLHSQCRLEGCSASIVIEDARFLVCKHQLAHVSEFFRTLFMNNRALPQTGVRQLSTNEYTIAVSSLKHPPQFVQFQWFIECTIPGPVLRDMADDILETCMRLSKRFGAKGLEVEKKAPTTALCWLNWSLKHRFDRGVVEACMLVAARLSLVSLEKHRNMVTEKIFADMLSMKLRTCYKQTASVFHTIHKMDHFHIEVDKCPRCSRQRDQGRIRVLANPCQKLIGCERCLKDLGCEIERKAQSDLQAFYQCDHGLMPFGEETEDCQCQQKLYHRRVQSATITEASQPPSEQAVEFDADVVSGAQ